MVQQKYEFLFFPSNPHLVNLVMHLGGDFVVVGSKRIINIHQYMLSLYKINENI